MVGEDVACPQDSKQVGDLGRDAAQARLRGRRPGLFFQVGAVELSQHREAAHVEQTVDLIHVGRLQLQLARQQLEHLGGHAGIDLQTHDPCMPATAAQLGLDRGQQVLGIAVDVVQVAVAGDPERVMGDDLHAGKKRGQVKRDHILERHVTLAFNQRDEARQDGWDLDASEPLLPALRIANHHREVQREMRDVRKRMAGVDREWCQHWEDLLAENRVQLGQLFLAHLLAAHERDSRLCQGWNDLAVVDRNLAADQTFDSGADRLELLERRHSVRRGDRDSGQNLLFQTRNANLEEVVEVLAEDGQEAHAFEERELGILRHRQHPLIEVEPGELAVDVSGADR